MQATPSAPMRDRQTQPGGLLPPPTVQNSPGALPAAEQIPLSSPLTWVTVRADAAATKQSPWPEEPVGVTTVRPRT